MDIIEALELAKQGCFVSRKDWGDNVIRYNTHRGFYFYDSFLNKDACCDTTLAPEDYNADDWVVHYPESVVLKSNRMTLAESNRLNQEKAELKAKQLSEAVIATTQKQDPTFFGNLK